MREIIARGRQNQNRNVTRIEEAGQEDKNNQEN